MKAVRFLILCFVCVGMLVARQPKIKDYGTSASDSITVVAVGQGVENEGRYQVKDCATSREVLDKAIISRISNRRFVLARMFDGVGRGFQFVADPKNAPPIPDFGLLDGDIVYTSEMIE